MYSIHHFPYKIQETLVTYQDTILDDSDFEDDQEVLVKYKDKPLDYIEKTSSRKMEEI